MGGILGAVFNLLVCFGIPLGVLIYLCVAKRQYLVSFLLGMLTFTVSQLVLRIPLLTLASGQAWYVSFAVGSPILLLLLLSFTAGLFEETGRYLVMRFIMKRHHSWGDGVSFGLGHGGIEAVTIVGPEWVKMLATQTVLLSLASPLLIVTSGVERLLTLVVHVGLSLIVLQGVATKKTWLWPVAILLHTWVNFATVLTLYLTQSAWLSEGMLLICAVGFGAYIFLARKHWSSAAMVPAPGPADAKEAAGSEPLPQAIPPAVQAPAAAAPAGSQREESPKEQPAKETAAGVDTAAAADRKTFADEAIDAKPKREPWRQEK